MPVKLEAVTNTGQYVTEEAKSSTEYEILQQCIMELEAREKAKKGVKEVCRMDNIPIQNRLVKLIGHKPLLDCKIGSCDSKGLLESG